MSGGFFRGTSADQDTRFSNKQAKLLKSQKFPPELEHLVEMTKVKMDVMKPWIANRVTELIGFEDEVLINFIYGLLDKKVVNGKEIQISLTGFMERNTGKFMKELWSLLLSAQQNASGVPQQFLDAKEEETRKKKAETDRIANEIQRKKEKEKRENEQENNKKMDGDIEVGRDNGASLEPSKHQSRASSRRSTDEKETYRRNGSRGRSRGSRSPRVANYSRSPRHRHSRSPSKLLSNSRSQSEERVRSPSVSRSHQSKGRSSSPERRGRPSPRRSISPRRRHSPRRYLSPPRRRLSHSRRRSISPMYSRSPSPVRYRKHSPPRRRTRSPMRRRTRSPLWRRSSSQSRSRSQSPVRRRSPYVRRRSRSPIRRRSPISFRRRSPSPPRRRYQRSPSTPRRRSPSPVRRRSPLPGRKRLASPVRRRSPSPQDGSSPSAIHRKSPSPIRRISPKGRRSSPAQSPRERIRSHGKYSPTRDSSLSDHVDRPVSALKGSNASDHQSPRSLRSLQRRSHREVPALSPSPHKSPVSESAPAARKRSPSEERSRNSYEAYVNRKEDKKIRPESFSPSPKARQQKPHADNSDSSAEAVETKYSRDARERNYGSSGKVSSTPDKRKGSFDKVHIAKESLPGRLATRRTSEVHSRSDASESKKSVDAMKSEKLSGKTDLSENSDQRELPATRKGSSNKREKESYDAEGNRSHERTRSFSNDVKGHGHEQESLLKVSRKVEQPDRSGLVDSESGESDKHRAKVKDKRKHKRSEREEIASSDDASSDSHIEDRKEAKRRRKEEKRLKKEERRRRREERRRRREERRAEKRRLKSTDASSPSESEKDNVGHSSDDEYRRKRDTRGRDIEDTESEQKRLEIALREKALESLRAKKGISH